MATSPIQSASSVQGLAETLAKRFDTNGDGRLTTQEFTSVLANALSSSTSTASVPKTDGGSPRTQINEILSAYPDTTAGLSRALPELLSTIFGIRLDDTGMNASKATTSSTSSGSTGTTGTTGTTSATSGPVVDGAPYTGFTPKYPFEGFNFDREQNPGVSAKDAFAYLANQAPPPPFEDKAALGEWFKTHIMPGMNQLGHTILSVTEDKFTATNWQGTGEVDWVRGAGAPGAALAWQSSL